MATAFCRSLLMPRAMVDSAIDSTTILSMDRSVRKGSVSVSGSGASNVRDLQRASSSISSPSSSSSHAQRPYPGSAEGASAASAAVTAATTTNGGAAAAVTVGGERTSVPGLVPYLSRSRRHLPENTDSPEQRLDELRKLFNKTDGDPLRVRGIGAGAWGSVFIAQLADMYGHLHDKIDIRIWRRPGRALDKEYAERLFSIINSREDVLRRLLRRCAYLKYVEARLGDRVLYADEVLRDGFCVNMVDTPLCPLRVVTNLQEAVWDADIVVNSLPSTETRSVFDQIGSIWRERSSPPAVIISLAKGVEAVLEPFPHILTPTLIIRQATGVPLENLLYLGGPNIASEIYAGEYANARLCGCEKWRKPIARFLRQPHFAVWDNSDLVTHEVMGGLKNVYAVGAGIVAELTRESATCKSVYFAHSTSEMIYITQLLTEEPESLTGPLLADTYVTLLKGRNAWYGQQLAAGILTPAMGDNVKGKGMIQGVSAVAAFHDLLSHESLRVPHPEMDQEVPPIELCPILKTLYMILHSREVGVEEILDVLRDKHMYDPRDRIVLGHACRIPQLLLGVPDLLQNVQ